MRRTIEDARWTFFNSGYSRGLAEQLCGRELGFSSVVGCGVSVEDIVVAPDGRAARAELGWDERPVILTVSRLVRRKGIDTTMDALRVVLKSYPDCRYIVAGEGPDRSILERQAGDLCLADKVQFIGRVSAEKKRTLYLASTLYVMPSRAGDAGETEGFGISYLEANALGLAVIGSRAGGIPDAVGHGENGLLVDPHDPVELAEAIVALLGDPERRRRMALAGQDRIRLRFNWMAIVNQIEEKLHDVVVQHGRTTAAIGQSARLTAGRGSSV